MAVAQLVESRIVIPVVVGSSPISHPSISRKKPLQRGFFLGRCTSVVQALRGARPDTCKHPPGHRTGQFECIRVSATPHFRGGKSDAKVVWLPCEIRWTGVLPPIHPKRPQSHPGYVPMVNSCCLNWPDMSYRSPEWRALVGFLGCFLRSAGNPIQPNRRQLQNPRIRVRHSVEY